MLLGRCLYGIGGSGQFIAAVILIVKYTQANQLTLYQGILTSVAFFGYAANSLGSPMFSKYFGASGVCFVGVIVCFLASIATQILYHCDKAQSASTCAVSSSNFQSNKDQNKFQFNMKNILFKTRSLSGMYWVNVALMMLLYAVQKSSYYYVPLVIIDKWQIIFFNIKQARLTPKNMTLTEPEIANKQIIAGNFITIQFIIAIFLVPLIGYYVDKKGNRLILFDISVALTIIQLILLLFIPPLIPSLLGGMAISLFFAVKRPLLALIVDKPELGLGYGIQQATQNFGVLILPIYLVNLSSNMILWILIILSFLSIITLIILKIIDKARAVSLDSNNVAKITECLIDEKAEFKQKNLEVDEQCQKC